MSKGFVPFVHMRDVPRSDREFRVLDPDGYCVMVADAEAIVLHG